MSMREDTHDEQDGAKVFSDTAADVVEDVLAPFDVVGVVGDVPGIGVPRGRA